MIAERLTTADYHRLARQFADADGACRVTLLSTCTMEFARPFLIVEGARAGFRVTPRFGPFGQVEQLINDPSSMLYTEPADVLVLAMRPEDVSPGCLMRPLPSGASPLQQVLAELVDRLARCVEAFRARSTAPVLVANFADPARLPLGPFDASVGGSLTYLLAEANARLRERIATLPDCATWDLAGLVRRHGAGEWMDRRLWAMARVPVAQRNQPALASHLVRTIRGLMRTPAKCLVLDLDNTLWGGVIGDDGMAGIQLGDDYPGNLYKEFQRQVLALADRGILLAVVSKNDHAVAMEVFQRHPDMLIKWEDLAAARINWAPKSGNLREIAKELNIGVDSLVFFDDNPVEQAEVRMESPEVQVVDVPADALGFSDALSMVPWFDQVSVSAEDRQRTVLYRMQRDRTDEARRFGSVDEFLASLEMTAEEGELSETTMARVAQLIGKTNQFNLTTRRHSAADLATFAADRNSAVVWLRVADRFGDQGLVGVGVLHARGEVGIIDTLLMSCRVMNRRVEVALTAVLVEHARRLGCRELIGEYLPTKKNFVVSDLYPTLGFTPVSGEDGRYLLDLSADTIEWPAVIRRLETGAAAAGPP